MINWKLRVGQMYENGFYTKEDVAYFVVKGRITAEDYEEITGEEYVE